MEPRHLNQGKVTATTGQPITERCNLQSKNIDTALPVDIIDILHSCEREIFEGWQDYQNIYDVDILNELCRISSKAACILQNPSDGVVVMSGCGTSGRLAFFVATKMNKILRTLGLPECFEYIIAGGNRALTHSVESFEDSPGAGSNSLQQVCQDKKKVLFIGITCGLSAPFVAGQLDHCMHNLETFTPVLLGFNPAVLARDRPIESWDQTFLTVTERLKELHREGLGLILNPVIGPEAITGSSRLKGGGATKMLLEACFLCAISCHYFSSFPATTTLPQKAATATRPAGTRLPSQENCALSYQADSDCSSAQGTQPQAGDNPFSEARHSNSISCVTSPSHSVASKLSPNVPTSRNVSFSNTPTGKISSNDQIQTETSCENATSSIMSSSNLPPPCRKLLASSGHAIMSAEESSRRVMKIIFDTYRNVWEEAYQTSRNLLADLLEWAGSSLKSGDHVYYIGWESYGILGLIDASECPPTFGSDFEDVRGFLKGGLSPLSTNRRQNVPTKCEDDEMSLEYFKANTLPSVNERDTVIFLLPLDRKGEFLQELECIIKQVSLKTDQIAIISVNQDSAESSSSARFPTLLVLAPQRDVMDNLTRLGIAPPLVTTVCQCVTEFAVKSCLNAISTGAHIVKGKVFENFMVDLKLSNSKLLQRGIGIVQKFTGCSTEGATQAVMRSILGRDDVASAVNMPMSFIVQIAGTKEKVVPVAIVLALKSCPVQEARRLLDETPVIRTALRRLIQAETE